MVCPFSASIAARPSRTDGRPAMRKTVATRWRLLARPDGDREVAQLAAADDPGLDGAADAVGPKQALQVVGIAHRSAVDLDQDVALQHAAAGGRAIVGH